jgi:hypothetical protein
MAEEKSMKGAPRRPSSSPVTVLKSCLAFSFFSKFISGGKQEEESMMNDGD